MIFWTACFDIGAVLVSVNLDWGSALRQAGLAEGPTPYDGVPLWECPGFEEHEEGLLPDEPYLARLAEFLELPPQLATQAQIGILGEEIPGMTVLLKELLQNGIRTACLSNTNPIHWPLLDGGHRYPVMGLVQHRFGSHLVGARKPSAQAYRRVQLALGGGKVAFFDDSAANVEGALREGWKAGQIHTGDVAGQVRRALDDWGLLKLSTA